jgi:hypothetical protein
VVELACHALLVVPGISPLVLCVDGSRRHEMNLSLAMEVEVGAKYNHGEACEEPDFE